MFSGALSSSHAAPRPPSACRVLCEALSVVADVRSKDDRLYVASGQKAFVAHRGWGVYRYWMRESRGATMRWVNERLDEVERMVHGGEVRGLRDTNRLLTALFMFRKGLHRLSTLVYVDDDKVRDEYALQSRRVETVLSVLRLRSRELRPVQRVESSMPFVISPTFGMGSAVAGAGAGPSGGSAHASAAVPAMER